MDNNDLWRQFQQFGQTPNQQTIFEFWQQLAQHNPYRPMYPSEAFNPTPQSLSLREPLTLMFSLGLQSWTRHVFMPAKALRDAGLYRPLSLGCPPAAEKFRGGEAELSLEFTEPVYLDAASENHPSVAAFDECAQDYEQVAEVFTKPIFEETLALLAPHRVPNARILDPSAGPGREARQLAKMLPEGEVVVADLARGMVETAYRKARAEGLNNMAFFQRDVVDPHPKFEGYFDAVHCSIAFHHFPDGLGAAQAFKRVLAPKGKAFIADAGPDWFKLLSYGFSKLFDPGFVQHRNGDEFRELFLKAGFKDVYWIEALPGIGYTVASVD